MTLGLDSGSPGLVTRVRVRMLQVVTLVPYTGLGYEDSGAMIQVSVRLCNVDC